MTHRISLRPQAEADLDSVYVFIARDNPKVARLFVDRLKGQLQSLSQFPERGAPREEYGPGVRVLTFERRVGVYYRVLEGEVDIVAVIYAGRDVSSVLTPDRLFK